VSASPAASAPGGAIPTVLIGATGRVGVNIVRLLPQFPQLRLCGATASEHSAALGEDVAARLGLAPSGISISAALPPLLQGAALAIDFSTAAAAAANIAACVAAGVPLLLGTTGLAAELAAPLTLAAERIALLVAPNTSLGLNLLLNLVQAAAGALPPSYDIEIVEAHHRQKADAPSGTALALGTAIAQARGGTLESMAVYARHGGLGTRDPGQIGIVSVRGGDVVGEHEVQFLGEGERLVLRHSVGDRSVFARGALTAGQWLARQVPGRYRMSDVFS
jgi:4-hydroxy-tetrahydrodipicolinate reductase